MSDEIELKDKIFVVKKGTKLGKPYVSYHVTDCLFILNTSKKYEQAIKRWEDNQKQLDFSLTQSQSIPPLLILGVEKSIWTLDGQNRFEGICWTNFKKRWQVIDEAQRTGKTLSTLDSELVEEEEISISNKIVSKGW